MSNRISPLDYRFTPVDPDPDFDAEHNRKVIEESIKAGEALWRAKQRKFSEGVGERSWAIAHYVDAYKMGAADSSVKNFFGEKELVRLKGEKILNKIKKEAVSPNGKATKMIKDFYAKTKRQRQ